MIPCWLRFSFLLELISNLLVSFTLICCPVGVKVVVRADMGAAVKRTGDVELYFGRWQRRLTGVEKIFGPIIAHGMVEANTGIFLLDTPES